MEFPILTHQVQPKFTSVGREDFSPEIAVAKARERTKETAFQAIGTIISPFLQGERDARVSAALAEAQGRLQQKYRELEQSPDYDSYDELFTQYADQTKQELGDKLKWPGARKEFEDRYEQLRGQYNRSVADLWSARSLSFRWQAYDAEQEANSSAGNDEAIRQTALTYVRNGTLDPAKASQSVNEWLRKSHYVQLKKLATTTSYRDVIDALVRGDLDEKYGLRPGEGSDIAGTLTSEYKVIQAIDLERREEIEAETYMKALEDLRENRIADPKVLWDVKVYPELDTSKRQNLEDIWTAKYYADQKEKKNEYLAGVEVKIYNGEFGVKDLENLISAYPEEAEAYRKKLEALQGGDAHDKNEAEWDTYLSYYWRNNALTQAHLDDLATEHPDMVEAWTARYRQQMEELEGDERDLIENTDPGYRTSFYAMLWAPDKFSYDYIRKWLINNHGPTTKDGKKIARIGTNDFDKFMGELESVRKKIPDGAVTVQAWVEGFFEKKIAAAKAGRDSKKLADMEAKKSAVLEALAKNIESGQFDPKATLERVQALCNNIDKEIVEHGIANLFSVLEPVPKRVSVFEASGRTSEGIEIVGTEKPSFTALVERPKGWGVAAHPQIQPKYAELAAGESLIKWTTPDGKSEIFIYSEKTGEIFDAYTHKLRTDIRVKK